MKILVIGGAGYLGSVIVRRLLDNGYKVRVLDTLFYGAEPIKDLNKNPDFEFFKGDIRNVLDIIKALEDKTVDAVIHLAAIVGDQACDINPEVTKEINIKATRDIAQLCIHFKVPRMIFTSTCSVYGGSGDEFDERSEVAPITLYGDSKITCERELIRLKSDSFHPTIFRLATLYGLSPRMRFDLAINLFIAKAIADKGIVVFGGSQWRPFIHVSDCADAFVSLLKSPVKDVSGETINIGFNAQNFTIMEIADKIRKIFPHTELTVREDIQDKRNYKVNFDKAKNLLNLKPSRDIDFAAKEISSFIKREKVDYQSPKYSNFKYISTDEDLKKRIYTSDPI